MPAPGLPLPLPPHPFPHTLQSSLVLPRPSTCIPRSRTVAKQRLLRMLRAVETQFTAKQRLLRMLREVESEKTPQNAKGGRDAIHSKTKTVHNAKSRDVIYSKIKLRIISER